MSWNYHVPYQDTFEDRRPRTKEDAAFDKLDAQGVRNVVERAMLGEEEKARIEQFHKDEQTFRVMYPAYKDSQHNAHAMKHHWENVLGVAIPTLTQMEDSFFELRNSGVIQLNQQAVAKENQEQILRRAAEIRETREAMEFNEESAYTLPLEEVERRARQGW